MVTHTIGNLQPMTPVNKLKLVTVFIASSIISLLVSCSPQKQKFKVDNSISSHIDSIYKVHQEFDSDRRLLLQLKRTFDYKRFGQSRTDLAYLLKADSSQSTEKYLAGGSQCYVNKDTLELIGILNNEFTIALIVLIFDDEFDAQLRLTATENIYSETEKESDLQSAITLNPDNISLILTEKPKFKSGSSLKGKMDVKFKPFYQVDSSNRLSKISPQFSFIFDTEIR